MRKPRSSGSEDAPVRRGVMPPRSSHSAREPAALAPRYGGRRGSCRRAGRFAGGPPAAAAGSLRRRSDPSKARASGKTGDLPRAEGAVSAPGTRVRHQTVVSGPKTKEFWARESCGDRAGSQRSGHLHAPCLKPQCLTQVLQSCHTF